MQDESSLDKRNLAVQRADRWYGSIGIAGSTQWLIAISIHPLNDWLGIFSSEVTTWIQRLAQIGLCVFAILLFFPPHKVKYAEAESIVQRYATSGNPKVMDDSLRDFMGSPGMNAFTITARHYAPLAKVLMDRGITPPVSVESVFRRLDLNPFNLFWIPIRRERRRRGLIVQVDRRGGKRREVSGLSRRFVSSRVKVEESSKDRSL